MTELRFEPRLQDLGSRPRCSDASQAGRGSMEFTRQRHHRPSCEQRSARPALLSKTGLGSRKCWPKVQGKARAPCPPSHCGVRPLLRVALTPHGKAEQCAGMLLTSCVGGPQDRPSRQQWASKHRDAFSSSTRWAGLLSFPCRRRPPLCIMLPASLGTHAVY